jgi:streptomycin 6-kinase
MNLLNKNYLQDNDYFVSNIKEIYSQTGEQWLRNLSIKLSDLGSKWDFQITRVMPELSYSFVALVKYKSHDAILKMAPVEQCLEREIQCLASFQKDSPIIFNFDKEYNAALMEYIHPGKSLKTLVKAGNDDKATEIICGIIRELRFQNKINYPFKHMSDTQKDLDILIGHFDKKLLDKAINLFHELTHDRSNDILLHGDLHHDNILSSGDSWKVIDPHGYIGDPVAEVGAMIRNPYDCLPEVPPKKLLARRLSILKNELPYDEYRIKAWCYCISVLSVAWTYEGFRKVTDSDKELIKILNEVCF